jgi:hypothetical protein
MTVYSIDRSLICLEVVLEDEGYITIPVRESGDEADLTNLATDEMPSDTLPRV